MSNAFPHASQGFVRVLSLLRWLDGQTLMAFIPTGPNSHTLGHPEISPSMDGSASGLSPIYNESTVLAG